MAQLVLDKLTKRYGAVLAVDGVDLHVPDQELLVLVGPSGCGKTSTLRLIAGLEPVTSGRIRLGDRIVNELPPRARNVALVFQHGALYPHLSVYQNLAFSLTMRRRPRAEIDRRVRDAAQLLGLTELLDRRPSQLSGGQGQRVALGRAIVRRPDVFLLDEPLSDLDAPLRAAMRTELVQLQRRLATTMIHVTHDQVEAMTMGHRVAVLRAGRLQQVGPPRQVYDAPCNRFVAEFLGNPPMRFVPGVLRGDAEHLEIDCAAFRLPVPADRRDRYGVWAGREVLVGIRPEAVRDVPPPDGDPAWIALRAEVTLVESLGADTILELRCGAHGLTARGNARRSYTPGEQIDVYLHSPACHVFDPASEVRL